MRYFACLFLILFTTFGAVSQSNIRMSNNWIDMYFMSPASIDPYYSNFKAGIGGRHQWIKLPGAPITEAFTVAYFNPGWRSQFGIRGFFDKIGYTTTSDISATYAYVLNLAPSSSDRFCKLNMGIAAKYQSLSYDPSKVVFETSQEDIGFFDRLQNKSKINFDLGFELAFGKTDPEEGGNCLIGIASQNITSLFGSGDNSLTTFANTNFFYAQYNSKLQNLNNGKQYAYIAGFSLMHSKNLYAPSTLTADVFQWEVNGKVRYHYTDANSFSFGVLSRTKEEYKKLNDWGVLLEHDWQKRLSASFVYENNFSSIGRASNTWGTFEIIFIWRLNPNKDLYDLDAKTSKFICR